MIARLLGRWVAVKRETIAGSVPLVTTTAWPVRVLAELDAFGHRRYWGSDSAHVQRAGAA